jgi:hypothetical protein
MVLVCVILVWAPIPLGSNRPWSWSLLAAAISLALVLWSAAQITDSLPRAKAVWPVAMATATTVPAWGWAFLQTLPAATFAWPAPQTIWAQAVGAGMAAAVPLLGLDADSGRDALMRHMCYAAMFWLAWRLGLESARARRLLGMILATVTLCASYALLAQFAGWEAIGWIPKTAYIATSPAPSSIATTSQPMPIWAWSSA